MPERLPTGLWVKAHAARCSVEGTPMVVARRGDPHRGVVLVKIHVLQQGFRIVMQARDLEGELVWSPAFEDRIVPEFEADEYIERQVSYDPDLWIVEIETRNEDCWFRGAVV